MCQSWWCGGGEAVAIEGVPCGTRILLSCGCAGERRDTASEGVTITVHAAHCTDHRVGTREQLRRGTPVHIDLLGSMLTEKR